MRDGTEDRWMGGSGVGVVVSYVHVAYLQLWCDAAFSTCNEII